MSRTMRDIKHNVQQYIACLLVFTNTANDLYIDE